MSASFRENPDRQPNPLFKRWDVLDADGNAVLWVEAWHGKVAFCGAVQGVSDDVLQAFQSAMGVAWRESLDQRGALDQMAADARDIAESGAV